MGPGPEWARPKPDEERLRLQARVDAAMRRGWVIRYDVTQDEYTAAREVLTARTVAGLLDAIEGAEGADGGQA